MNDNKTPLTRSNMPQFGGSSQNVQEVQTPQDPQISPQPQISSQSPISTQNAPVAAPQPQEASVSSAPQSYGSPWSNLQETPQNALGTNPVPNPASISPAKSPVSDVATQPKTLPSNTYSRRWHLWLLGVIAVVLVSVIGVVVMLIIKGGELGKTATVTDENAVETLPATISVEEGLRRICDDPAMRDAVGLRVGSGVVGTHLTGETYTAATGDPEYLWICDWRLALKLEPSSDLLVNSNGAFVSGDSLLLSAITLDTEYYKDLGTLSYSDTPQFYLGPQEYGTGGLVEIKRLSTAEIERIASDLRKTDGDAAAEAYLSQATRDVEFATEDYQFVVEVLQSSNEDNQDLLGWENESRIRLLKILLDERNWVVF